jgi:hypothetical protein
MAMYELRYEELTDDFQQLIDRIIARNEPVILIDDDGKEFVQIIPFGTAMADIPESA